MKVKKYPVRCPVCEGKADLRENCPACENGIMWAEEIEFSSPPENPLTSPLTMPSPPLEYRKPDWKDSLPITWFTCVSSYNK